MVLIAYNTFNWDRMRDSTLAAVRDSTLAVVRAAMQAPRPWERDGGGDPAAYGYNPDTSEWVMLPSATETENTAEAALRHEAVETERRDAADVAAQHLEAVKDGRKHVARDIKQAWEMVQETVDVVQREYQSGGD